MDGTLYDDFRIADIETGDMIWCVVPRSGHTSLNGRAELWGKENSFGGPIVAGTWSEVLKYMQVK